MECPILYRQDLNLSYLINLKCASSSIRNLMMLNGGVRIFDNEKICPIVKQSYNFTFVRNPWARILSLYFWQLKSAFDLRTHLSEEFKVSCDDISLNYFDAFVRLIYQRGDEGCNRHYVSQCYVIDHFPGMIDFIGRVENMNEDWGKLQKKNKNLPIITKSKESQHYRYQHYYNDTTRQLVAERYIDDIMRFDYSFD